MYDPFRVVQVSDNHAAINMAPPRGALPWYIPNLELEEHNSEIKINPTTPWGHRSA